MPLSFCFCRLYVYTRQESLTFKQNITPKTNSYKYRLLVHFPVLWSSFSSTRDALLIFNQFTFKFRLKTSFMENDVYFLSLCHVYVSVTFLLLAVYNFFYLLSSAELGALHLPVIVLFSSFVLLVLPRSSADPILCLVFILMSFAI